MKTEWFKFDDVRCRRISLWWQTWIVGWRISQNNTSLLTKQHITTHYYPRREKPTGTGHCCWRKAVFPGWQNGDVEKTKSWEKITINLVHYPKPQQHLHYYYYFVMNLHFKFNSITLLYKAGDHFALLHTIANEKSQRSSQKIQIRFAYFFLSRTGDESFTRDNSTVCSAHGATMRGPTCTTQNQNLWWSIGTMRGKMISSFFHPRTNKYTYLPPKFWNKSVRTNELSSKPPDWYY